MTRRPGEWAEKLFRRVLNLLLYRKWTDCLHDWVPEPDTFADWVCKNCGAGR